MAPNPCPALYSVVALVAAVLVSVEFLWLSASTGWPFSIAAMNHYRTYPIQSYHVGVAFRNPSPNRSHQIDNSRTLNRPDYYYILDYTYQMSKMCCWQHCHCHGRSMYSSRCCTDSKSRPSLDQNRCRWTKICSSPNSYRICHYNKKNSVRKRRKNGNDN